MLSLFIYSFLPSLISNYFELNSDFLHLFWNVLIILDFIPLIAQFTLFIFFNFVFCCLYAHFWSPFALCSNFTLLFWRLLHTLEEICIRLKTFTYTADTYLHTSLALCTHYCMYTLAASIQLHLLNVRQLMLSSCRTTCNCSCDLLVR